MQAATGERAPGVEAVTVAGRCNAPLRCGVAQCRKLAGIRAVSLSVSGHSVGWRPRASAALTPLPATPLWGASAAGIGASRSAFARSIDSLDKPVFAPPIGSARARPRRRHSICAERGELMTPASNASGSGHGRDALAQLGPDFRFEIRRWHPRVQNRYRGTLGPMYDTMMMACATRRCAGEITAPDAPATLLPGAGLRNNCSIALERGSGVAHRCGRFVEAQQRFGVGIQ